MASVVVVPLARLPEADLHYSEALVDRELALGSTHPLTVLALGNLAHQTAAQEDKIADSESMLREELAAHMQSFGADHPNVLQAKVSLARTLAMLGQNDEARKLVREAAASADRDPSRGTGLPDVAGYLLHACASVLQLMEEDGEADTLLRAALQTLRAAPRLGAGSASAAEASGAALGVCLALELGDPTGAEVQALLAEARGAWEQQALAGAPSPLVLGTNLAARLLQPRWAPEAADASGRGRLRYQSADCVVADPGVLEQAEPLLQLASDSRRVRLGPGHPHSLTALGNLAVCRLALEEAADAERLFREQHAGLEALGLAPGDPGLQECTVNLARSLEALGRLEEARDLYAAVAEEAAVQEGATASGALLSHMADLARCEAALGNAPEAEALLREVHDNCVEELGFAHAVTRVSAYELAQHLQDHDKLSEAEALLEAFRAGSAPANAPAALEAEPPAALCVITSAAGLLRAMRP